MNAPSFYPIAREIVAGQQAARSAHRTGVTWSGLSAEAPPVEDVDAVAAHLEKMAAEAEAFRKSPRGRFVAAVKGIEQYQYFEEADRLRGEYTRNLSDARQPLNTASVGACMAILIQVPGQAARDALSALAELLMSETRRAA